MVAEIRITSTEHISKAEPTLSATSLTGSQGISIVRIQLDEDRAVEGLGFEAFANDWESDADSIYDDFLGKDADVR